MSQRRCLLSGSTGYIGKNLCSFLRKHNIFVTELKRERTVNSIHYKLGDCLDSELLEGYDILIHAAYDFSLAEQSQINEINVGGSHLLFNAAIEAGVKHIILISSLASFNNAESYYGRAKFNTEKLLARKNDLIIRPGLVFGKHNTGTYNMIANWIINSPIIPLLYAPNSELYACHIDDFCSLLLELIQSPSMINDSDIIYAAHPDGTNLRTLINLMQKRLRVKKIILPIHWKLPWLILRLVEILGFTPPIRSDSIKVLVTCNKNLNFRLTQRFKTTFRNFS